MPRERCTIKVTKHGNSLHVSLPRPLRHGLGIVCGDLLNVELYRDLGCIVIQKYGAPPPQVLPQHDTGALPEDSRL